MNRLLLAIKLFFKSFSEPEKAQLFLEDKPKKIESADPSHLRLLTILQQSGRLIDFLKEDISEYSDAQVGAAVRKIHQDCSKTLEDIVTIRPVMDEAEGSTVKVVPGYNSSQIKVIGKIKGEPPFSGILVHKGWKAHKKSLPKKVGEQADDVLSPAEIEVQ